MNVYLIWHYTHVFMLTDVKDSSKPATETYIWKKHLLFDLTQNIYFFGPKYELVIFSWRPQILGVFRFSNMCCGQFICPAALLMVCLISQPLRLNSFKRGAIGNYYLTFNCTGNVWVKADLSPGDIIGGVMKNTVWYRTKPWNDSIYYDDIDIA